LGVEEIALGDNRGRWSGTLENAQLKDWRKGEVLKEMIKKSRRKITESSVPKTTHPVSIKELINRARYLKDQIRIRTSKCH
jgi:hypothetical protein